MLSDRKAISSPRWVVLVALAVPVAAGLRTGAGPSEPAEVGPASEGPPLAIRANALGFGEACVPATMVLGVLAPGGWLSARLALRSLTGAAFEILDATTAGDGRDLRVRLQEKYPATFQISGTATGQELQAAEASFAVRHRDGVSYPITVSVRHVAAANPR